MDGNRRRRAPPRICREAARRDGARRGWRRTQRAPRAGRVISPLDTTWRRIARDTRVRLERGRRARTRARSGTARVRTRRRPRRRSIWNNRVDIPWRRARVRRSVDDASSTIARRWTARWRRARAATPRGRRRRRTRTKTTRLDRVDRRRRISAPAARPRRRPLARVARWRARAPRARRVASRRAIPRRREAR